MFKIKFKFKKEIKPAFRPTQVWRWLMTVFLILVSAVFIGGYLAYGRLANLEVSSQRRIEQEALSSNRLDLKTLEQVRAILDAKATQTENLKLNPPAVSNPAVKLK